MRKHSNDLAVSESLGYILIFGIVMACIVLVYQIGSQIIADNQKSASFQTMSQNFNVVQSDLVSTASGSSPVMTTQMSVSDGTLALLPETRSNCQFVINFNGEVTTIPMGKLKYSSDLSREIALEDGAIITSYGLEQSDGSIMLKTPKMYYSPTNNALIIATIDINGDYSAVSSSFISLQLKSGDVPTPETIESGSATGETVEFWIQTDYTVAWSDFLANIPGIVAVDAGSSGDWVKMTLYDKNYYSNPAVYPDNIKKIIIVQYGVDATIG